MLINGTIKESNMDRRTSRNIVIEKNEFRNPADAGVEIVERKGLGHPDTLIDGIMEEVSLELCRYYLENFGCILHHNVDKGLIVGGRTSPKFNGGELLAPIYILLAGRATGKYIRDKQEKDIPVHPIAINAARKFLRENTRNLNLDKDVIIDSKIFEGSVDLKKVFNSKNSIPLANDTSFGIGYAPLTDTERITLEVERKLNSKEYKEKKPYVGEMIKIMSLREKDRIKMTCAVAFVDKYVSSPQDYFEKKEVLKEDILRFASKLIDKELDVEINTADSRENEIYYITVTGLSCEMGDDGSVGRGNRTNGIISPLRSMTLEAAAGKNPVNHVGKIYSVVASETANKIVKEIPEVRSASVILLSQIGKPVDLPKVANIRIDCNKMEEVKRRVLEIVDHELEDISEYTEKIIKKKTGIWY